MRDLKLAQYDLDPFLLEHGIVPGTLLQPQEGQTDAVYLRVSSDAQLRAAGPADQYKACVALITQLQWQTNPLIFLEAESATEDMKYRPVLTHLRNLMSQGRIKRIVLERTGRLSRIGKDQMRLVLESDECSARYFFAMNSELNGDLDDGVRYLLQSLHSFKDDNETKESKQKRRDGMYAKVQRNHRLQGNHEARYGYEFTDIDLGSQYQKGRYIVEPIGAHIVIRIFLWYTRDGWSMYKIARQLNSDCTPTPKGSNRNTGKVYKWSAKTVSELWKCRDYIGDAIRLTHQSVRQPSKGDPSKLVWIWVERPQEEWVHLPEGTIPRLGYDEVFTDSKGVVKTERHEVTDDVFYEAQRLLTANLKNFHRPASNPETHLLRDGYIICGTCGGSLSPCTRKPSKRMVNDSLYYQCSRCGIEHGNPCPDPVKIAVSKIDAPVWDNIATFLMKDENIDQIMNQRRENAKLDPVHLELKRINTALVKLQQQLSNVYEMGKNATSNYVQARAKADTETIENQLVAMETERNEYESYLLDVEATERKVGALKTHIKKIRRLLSGTATRDGEPVTVPYALKRTVLDMLDIKVKAFPIQETGKGMMRENAGRFTTVSIIGPIDSTHETVTNELPLVTVPYRFVILWNGTESPVLLTA